MNLIPQNNKKPGARKILIVFFILFSFLGGLFILSAPVIDFLSQNVHNGASVIFSGGTFLKKISDIYSPFIINKKTLFNENKELSARLGEANAKLWTARLLEEENRSLKNLLGRNNVNEERIVGAVLVSSNKNPYGTFIVDIGAKQGASEGDIIFSFERIAIGEITLVSNNHSTAILYSAPNKKTNARLETSHVPVFLVGRGGGDFEIQLPKDILVLKGEAVIFGGLDSIILGIVKEIDFKPSDSTQTIYVSSPVNVHTLDKIFIIKP